MTRANYTTELTALRHEVARRINHRSVLGKNPNAGDRQQLLTIGLFLKLGLMYTPAERADIHYFLKQNHV